MPDSVTLPSDFSACERGNTWLTNGEGDYAAWLDLPGGTHRLQVIVTCDNYPGLFVGVIPRDDAKLRDTIHADFDGWLVRKCNIDGVTVTGGCIGNGDEDKADPDPPAEYSDEAGKCDRYRIMLSFTTDDTPEVFRDKLQKLYDEGMAGFFQGPKRDGKNLTVEFERELCDDIGFAYKQDAKSLRNGLLKQFLSELDPVPAPYETVAGVEFLPN